MGYLFLGLATLFGLTKGYCGKKVSTHVKESRDAVFSNILRMAICIVIGFFFVVVINGFSGFNIGFMGFLISAISGISSAIFVVSWLFAVKRGAYMLVSVFLTLGLLIPIAFSSMFFGEQIEWNHYVGFAILLLAVAVMCSYSSSVKTKIDLTSYLILTVCGLAQGFSSFSQKWFVRELGESAVSSFNFYTYVFSTIVLVITFFFVNTKDKSENGEEAKKGFQLKQIWLYILIMAIMLFLNSYFMTLSASRLDAILLYPLSTGLSLILSAMMSSIAFKEKLTTRCVIGIALSFVSLIFINLL